MAVVRPIDPDVQIGHVHLKVADLDRALKFYCGVLGFELTARYGPEAAFVSAGGYHHHIGSTPGKAAEDRPRHPEAPGCIMWPSDIPLARRLPMYSCASRRPAFRCRVRPIMVSAKLSISRIPPERVGAVLGSPEKRVATWACRRVRHVHAASES